MTTYLIHALLTTSLVVFSTASVAQATRSASKGQPVSGQNFVAGDEIPMTPCADVVPNGVIGPPVTMKIDSLFKELKDKGKVKKDIYRKLPNGTWQEVVRPTKPTYLWPTNIDMQLAELNNPSDPQSGYKPNDYVMVTIVLKMERGIRFLQKLPLTGDDSSVAVMTQPGTGNRFCGRTNFTTGTGANAVQTVTFGVLKGSTAMSINIGLMIPDDVSAPRFWLPLIIDPIIENEG